MSTLKEDFEVMASKVVRLDEMHASIDAAQKRHYSGFFGKLSYLKFLAQSLGDLPRILKNFNKVAKLASPDMLGPEHVYVSENWVGAVLKGQSAKANQSDVYMDVKPLLENMRDALGEKALGRGVLMEALKNCPDHHDEIGKTIIVMREVMRNPRFR